VLGTWHAPDNWLVRSLFRRCLPRLSCRQPGRTVYDRCMTRLPRRPRHASGWRCGRATRWPHIMVRTPVCCLGPRRGCQRLALRAHQGPTHGVRAAGRGLPARVRTRNPVRLTHERRIRGHGGLCHPGPKGFDDRRVLAFGPAGLALLTGFVVHELKTTNPRVINRDSWGYHINHSSNPSQNSKSESGITDIAAPKCPRAGAIADHPNMTSKNQVRVGAGSHHGFRTMIVAALRK
jgi:hypothetical protein